MTREQKRALFNAGHYRMKKAPSDVWDWQEDDWVDWIDAHGVWEHPRATTPEDPNVRQAFGHCWTRQLDTQKHQLTLPD